MKYLPMLISVLGSGDTTHIASDTPLPAPLQRDSVHCELRPIPGAVFPATQADRRRCEQAYFEEGMAAAEAGAHAIYINTVGDYGLLSLQEALDIPIGGAGSGSFHKALSDAPD